MEQRIDYANVSHGALQAMLGLEKYLGQKADRKLLDLVYLRASQINGCAYCIDMHWKDLRTAGESEQRLYGLDAWRESPYYTDRERAALAMDGSGDAPDGQGRARRGVPGGAPFLLRGGARRPDPGHRGDQRLEPAEHRISDAGGNLQTREGDLEDPGSGGPGATAGSRPLERQSSRGRGQSWPRPHSLPVQGSPVRSIGLNASHASTG